MIGPVYRLVFSDSLFQQNNVLEIEYLILWLTQSHGWTARSYPGKHFYNINFPARKTENSNHNLFNASHLESQTFRDFRIIKPCASEIKNQCSSHASLS